MQRARVAGALALVLLAGARLPAEDTLKSGLQPGGKIPSAFQPLNVTGEQAGKKYCLVCENGLSPVVMVFARDASDPLVRLIGKIDAATGKHRAGGMGSFVVFLSDSEGLEEKLQEIARKNGLKHTVLSIDAPAGPESYRVARDADVTVVLYNQHVVKANHAFRKGQLKEKDIEKILADLPKILAAK